MRKILVVEDEKIIRRSLRRLLEKNQFAVAEAGSVNEAIGIMKGHSFDLIITDLYLPGDSGAKMISLAKQIPVLVMTSYASIKSAVELIKLGAKNYIAKPFNHTELLRVIQENLSEPSHSSNNPSSADNSQLAINDTESRAIEPL